MGLNYLAPAPFASFVTRNGVLQADVNGLIANVGPGPQALDLLQAGCVPLSFHPLSNPRNLIDAGDFTVNPWQRNIPGLASGGKISTAISSTVTYFADRFFAVGGASSAILMANVADTTVVGFSNSLLLTRQASNANTAPINCGQVLETADSVRAQNQTITFSFWARAGANYSGGSLTVQVIAGNSVNQSAAIMVAGSWTGQSSVINTTQALTTSMTRYQFSGVVPAATTQLGILLTWTPSGVAGAVDGIYLNGLQLEVGASASPFEHEDVQIVLEECQRYAWAQPEPASGVVVGAGQNTGASSQLFYMATPVQFYKAPTVTVSPSSFKTNQAGTLTATTITPGATHAVNAISVNGNSSGTAGQATMLHGGGGSGWILASADF